MTTLIIAEHNNQKLHLATACCISAASEISGGVHVLVAGFQCEHIALEVANFKYVTEVIYVDDEVFKNPVAEFLTSLVYEISGAYNYFLAPATTFGKDLMPQIAVRMDSQQISDIIAIESDDCFVRPIYAGNAIITVQSLDTKRCITVRPTAFEPALNTNNNADIHKLSRIPLLDAKVCFVA